LTTDFSPRPNRLLEAAEKNDFPARTFSTPCYRSSFGTISVRAEVIDRSAASNRFVPGAAPMPSFKRGGGGHNFLKVEGPGSINPSGNGLGFFKFNCGKKRKSP